MSLFYKLKLCWFTQEKFHNIKRVFYIGILTDLISELGNLLHMQSWLDPRLVLEICWTKAIIQDQGNGKLHKENILLQTRIIHFYNCQLCEHRSHQDLNSDCRIQMWNVVSYIKGGMHSKGICKQDPEASIWVQEGWEYRVELLNNEEHHNLYSSPNIVRVIKSRRLRWVGHIARMGKGRSTIKILTSKPTGKRPLAKPRCRW